MENEYYSTTQIAKKYGMNIRHIRRMVSNKSKQLNNKTLIHKDKNGSWQVNHVALHYFKPKYIPKDNYYALSLDPVVDYTESEIHEIMNYIGSISSDFVEEINYVIENKKKDVKAHIHMFIKSKNKRKLLKSFRTAFGEDVSYRQSKIYDLSGWKDYITKNNKYIITI